MQKIAKQVVIGLILLAGTASASYTYEALEAVHRRAWLSGDGITFPDINTPLSIELQLSDDEPIFQALGLRGGETFSLEVDNDTGNYIYRNAVGDAIHTNLAPQPYCPWLAADVRNADRTSLYLPGHIKVCVNSPIVSERGNILKKSATPRQNEEDPPQDSESVSVYTGMWVSHFELNDITNAIFRVRWNSDIEQPGDFDAIDLFIKDDLGKPDWAYVGRWDNVQHAGTNEVELILSPNIVVPEGMDYWYNVFASTNSVVVTNISHYCTSDLVCDPLAFQMLSELDLISIDPPVTNIVCETKSANIAFFSFGSMRDTNSNGLTDAYEILVKCSTPEKYDSDGDGMPDLWERDNGFDMSSPDDALTDLDNDGIPAVYEYHNGTDPNIDDWEIAPKTILSAKNRHFTLYDAFAQSRPYEIIVLNEGIYTGSGWSEVFFPKHPVLVSGIDRCKIGRVKFQTQQNDMTIFHIDDQQSTHTTIQGLIFELSGERNWQSAIWLGTGGQYYGEGSGGFFRSNYVKFVDHGIDGIQIGWFCRHSGTNKVILANNIINGNNALAGIGVYAVNSPPIDVCNTTFMNFPTRPESRIGYGLQYESNYASIGLPPQNISLVNCLFDESFTESLVLAPLEAGFDYKIAMSNCIVPCSMYYQPDYASNIVTAVSSITTTGLLTSNSIARATGIPIDIARTDTQGEFRNVLFDVGADTFCEESSIDLDGDGVSDVQEIMFGTAPEFYDSDGDGMTDGVEIASGYDPITPGPWFCTLTLTVTNTVDQTHNFAALYCATIATNSVPDPSVYATSLLEGVNEIVFDELFVPIGYEPTLFIFHDINHNGLLDINEPKKVYYLRHQNIHSELKCKILKSDLDFDSDGIPNEWEYAHGLNPENPQDAYLDPDNDGLINLNEYRYGTDINTSNAVTTAIATSYISLRDRLLGRNPQTDWTMFENYIPNGQTNTFIRNPNFWASDLDFSCVAVWNTYEKNKRAAVAISPWHILMAAHYPINTGSQVYFLDTNGVLVARTITRRSGEIISNGGYSTDLVVGLLNEALPDTVSIAKILPANYADFIDDKALLPVISLDQEKKAICRVIECFNQISGSRLWNNYATAKYQWQNGFYEPTTDGDSGNPNFLCINQTTILLSLHYGKEIGFPIVMGINEIDQTMASLKSGYQLCNYDISQYLALINLITGTIQ